MKPTDHLTRQLEIIPVETLDTPITIVGAGAIGSFTALALAKMGFENLTVYDFDQVSIENMNCQWYRMGDIGKPKVEALAELIEDFTGVKIAARDQRFAGTPSQQDDLRGIVISAVDSMEVRTMLWGYCKGKTTVNWYIDPRMAAEYALTFVMNPNLEKDQQSYEKTLYTDKNAVEERCTAKATMYTATMIAGYVAKHVKDLVTKKPYARITHWDISANELQNWSVEQ